MSIITHADIGGLTSAVHLLSHKHVDASVFKASPALPWDLVHIIDAACLDVGQETGEPIPFVGHIACRPISDKGVLRQEGLLDVFGAFNAKLHAHVFLSCQNGLSDHS